MVCNVQVNGKSRASEGNEVPWHNFTEPGGVHEDDGPRTYPFGQCRCGGIQHMGCCTPHLSCDWLVLGPWVHKLLPLGPEGTKGNQDG